MIDPSDVSRLRSAGIDDLGLLVGAAADYVRRHPLDDSIPSAASLSTEEVEALRSVGARGLDARPDELDRMNRANLLAVTAEYARMVATADTARGVAERLDVSLSRVRQRVAERSLHAIDGPSGRVFPRFQFGPVGPLPGLERVLTAIRPGAHPIVVERFFVHPTLDLESDVVDGPLCPRDWLLSGNPVEPVVELAGAL